MSGPVRTKRLTPRASPYNPLVTLYAPSEAGPSTTLRRSPRNVKNEPTEPKMEFENLDMEDMLPTVFKKVSPKKRSAPKKTHSPKTAPSGWEEQYEAIKAMRKRFDAPVDTMGCQRAQLEESEPKNQRFSSLVSLMLSTQTKDEKTHASVIKLREAVGGTLSVDAVIAAPECVVAQAIKLVGFWEVKAKYVKAAAQNLRDDHDSDVPKTIEELVALKGVGPKVGHLTLQIAWNITAGIGVDVHLARIATRLGWHKSEKNKPDPEKVRLDLEAWFPKENFREINHLFVGFGQVVCDSTSPRCDLCDLSARGLCPSSVKVSNTKNRKVVVLRPAEAAPKVEVTMDDAPYTIEDVESKDNVKKEEIEW